MEGVQHLTLQQVTILAEASQREVLQALRRKDLLSLHPRDAGLWIRQRFEKRHTGLIRKQLVLDEFEPKEQHDGVRKRRDKWYDAWLRRISLSERVPDED